MLALGITFWMVAYAPSAAPEGVLSGPRLKPGDELHYVGQIQQNGERVENRFRKKFKLEVRVFVLEVSEEATDCAVLTSIAPLGDESIQDAVRIAGGRTGLKLEEYESSSLRPRQGPLQTEQCRRRASLQRMDGRQIYRGPHDG